MTPPGAAAAFVAYVMVVCHGAGAVAAHGVTAVVSTPRMYRAALETADTLTCRRCGAGYRSSDPYLCPGFR